MGGFGSGQWTRPHSKGLVEHEQRIDIRRLKRDGRLVQGATGIIAWRLANGDDNGSVRFYTGQDTVTFRYCHRELDGTEKNVVQTIKIVFTKTNFNGRRPWFRCPDCGRRCGVLYGAGRLFSCRKCADLLYSSQKEDWAERKIRKARKIRQQLGGPPDVMEPFPDKPKGMHRTTYERLREEENRLVLEAMGDVARRLGLPWEG